MAAFGNAVSAVAVLLVLTLVGYLMGKLGWLGPAEKKFLGRYIINIAVPCNCISGVLGRLDRDMLGEAGWLLLLAFGLMIICLLFASLLAALLRLPKNRRGIFISMSGMSSCLFVGLPLGTQLFGDVCIPYVMIYYLANATLIQTVGVALIERSGTGGGLRPADFLKDLIKKPPIVTILICVLLLVLGVELPGVVMTSAEYISGSVSPLALIYTGYVTYELGLRNLRLERGLPTLTLVRLAAAPLICAGLCALAGAEGLSRDVFVMQSGLPVFTQGPVLAGTYGADDQYAASAVVLTTIGCFLTIPVMMFLLGG